MSTGDPVFAPWEDPAAWGLTFISGSIASYESLAPGTYSYPYPSGTVLPYPGPGVPAVDDPPVNEDPPFPGWDPDVQAVQLIDDDGVIRVAYGYDSLAICEDLELDAEDFAMRSAEIVLDPRPMSSELALKRIAKALTEATRMKALEAEIERLKAEIRRYEGRALGVSAPPPYTAGPGEIWKKKKPVVRPDWSGDPIFGPEAGGVPPLWGEMKTFPSDTAHDDSVDASSLSIGQLFRRAIGIENR